jgi:hypothetical protein
VAATRNQPNPTTMKKKVIVIVVVVFGEQRESNHLWVMTKKRQKLSNAALSGIVMSTI